MQMLVLNVGQRRRRPRNEDQPRVARPGVASVDTKASDALPGVWLDPSGKFGFLPLVVDTKRGPIFLSIKCLRTVAWPF